ncbi:MAG: hypothetical protein V3T72_17360 [Thermoanaerobaculia bacterium]
MLPFVLVLAVEGGLRLFGYGHSYPLFVPVPDTDDFLRVNRKVVFRFMVDEAKTPKLWIRPVFFRRHKTPETFRIFVQGGSTAEGYPYGYGASPAGMLQQRLQRTFPELEIDVITTAMSAVNTYTLLDFSSEILEQDPDAVVIYAGHNEYVGILGVGSGFSVGRWRPAVLSFLRFKDWRIFQLARGAFLALGPKGKARDDNRTLMATIVAEKRIPYGSSLYRRGLEQYRANLRALLKRYRRAGVPVFIGTMVSNERDQPPFVSDHGSGADGDAWRRHLHAGDAALESGNQRAAVAAFEAAIAVDDLHAEGHFGLGRALDARGRHSDARHAYVAARDRDQLRFRAPTEINRILRRVAAEQGAHVVEVEDAFALEARDGIVGHDLMLEHLHPNLDGYFIIADAFYDALREQRMIGPWDRPISRGQARQEIPVTEVDRLYGEYRIGYLTSDWPFSDRKQRFRLGRASDRVEEIAQSYYRGPKDWPVAMRDLLDHYRRVDDLTEAARVAVLLAEAFPNRAQDQQTAAELLAAAGRTDAEVYRRRAAPSIRPPAF